MAWHAIKRENVQNPGVAVAKEKLVHLHIFLEFTGCSLVLGRFLAEKSQQKY